METTEKIVEAYVRYVRHWATIPNVRCDGQQEIDLIAVDPTSGKHYHIETSVSVSQGFSKLTAKTFDPELRKQRVHQASMRRTLGFFVDHKFGTKAVKDKLAKYGFSESDNHKIIVTWGWTEDAKTAAKIAGIELWDFREIIRDIASEIRDARSYFTDDTLRTINLYVQATEGAARSIRTASNPQEFGRRAPARVIDNQKNSAPFWVYRNSVVRRARLHRAACTYCNDGAGMHRVGSRYNDEWRPFASERDAKAFLASTGYDDAKNCGVCMGPR
ncbi:hypothetical protein [Parvibaculum sp.]|uniref:hypothetical protein n=1 Tax=Parvibaculum sp. TaxID=2024848 RepID=UPI001DB558F7|nr:hypothetical protein [Parvibaculum sp.]MBX3490239.1 hypothetical protein [Parvibaculum sp.]MCW5729080.1 hypothetical protein [Parvibaculum sp.]